MSGLAGAFQSLPGARTGTVKVALEEQGLVLTMAGMVLFEPGSTTLRPESLTYLDQVAQKLQGVELPIMVEGTADERQTGSLSPWDLAALRAGSVVNYLVNQHGMPSSQFVTIGYGGGESGSNPDRRVSIVVMRGD